MQLSPPEDEHSSARNM